MDVIGKILSDQMGEKRVLFSEEAEQGAEGLLERAKNQELRMEILPNNYSQFTGELEENDYLSFARFVNSVYGKRVIKMMEEQDEEGLA